MLTLGILTVTVLSHLCFLYYSSRAKKAQTQIHIHMHLHPHPQTDICLIFLTVNREVPQYPPGTATRGTL